MKTGPVIDLALRCYPAWWRDRYSEEVRLVSRDLTLEGRSPLKVGFDLLIGAVRARSSADGMPRSYGLWSSRAKASIATATLPWLLVAPFLLFAIGNPSFHSSAGRIFWSGYPWMPTHLLVTNHALVTEAVPLTPSGHLVLYSSLAITLLILLTFLVLSSGWSGLTGAIRGSVSPHRRRLLLLAWTPVFALLADVGLVVAEGAVRPNVFTSHGGGPEVASGGNPTALHILTYVLPTVAIGGWLISLACVAWVSRRADIEMADLRFGKSVAVIVSVLFALLVVAYAAWGIGLLIQDREAATGGFTTVTYSHPGLWPPTMLVLVLVFSLSMVSARAARHSWRVLSSTYH